MKKVVYLKGSGLWDIISSVPKLFFLKEKWYTVDWIFFTNFNENYLEFLNVLKYEWLIDNILIVKNTYVRLIQFLLKNLKKYDEVIIWWILTKKNYLFWKILWKKVKYFIKDKNIDKSIIELENPDKKFNELLLYNFNFFSFNRKVIKDNYIVFYPSIFKRSINVKYIKDFLKIITNLNYKIVVLWWEREKWFKKYIEDLWKNNFISYLWKYLDYTELANILHYSRLNILHNWWIMWLWNLVNKYNININTVSYRIWQPIADNKTIFNFIPDYDKLWCMPCEWECVLKNKFICKNDEIFKGIRDIILKLIN